MDYAQRLAEQFQAAPQQVQNVIDLLDAGNTIPFIARYRKEMHGSMDDQQLRELSERLAYLRGLDERREEVRTLIAGQDKLTEELAQALDAAKTLSEIEDLYRPFRPKRKTRASVAREKGLAPLAEQIFAQQDAGLLPLEAAQAFVDPEKGVENAEEALNGALDILAEQFSDDAEIRKRIRNLTLTGGILSSCAAQEDTDSVYRLYYDFSEAVSKIAGHRVLALDRGEKEGFLKVSISVDEPKMIGVIARLTVRSSSPCGQAVAQAGEDAFRRLIFPSIEREVRSELTRQADEQAIRLFGTNLHQLLMQPPVKGKVAIGLDPGYRTGCKVAVVDATGRVLDTGVIYPTHSEAQVEKSKAFLQKMIRTHHAEIIAIGNGTASKETEMFTAEVLSQMKEPVSYMVVSEAGASVYSASKLAAAELPQLDLTLRSAVSIARRLQDPLAELVKIDPKAIGVGQYQHDMPPKQLAQALDGVVEDCVNTVGADLNTASPALLSRVAGLSETVCKNIVAYREEHGAFKTRAELKKVPKLGPKAFEQCAGFLRVPESKNPLDNTAVHPESYAAAEQLLSHFGLSRQKLAGIGNTLLQEARQEGMEHLAALCGVGVPTLTDILNELARPGRDPRDELPPPMLRTDVLDIKDLKEGMVLKGTVRNVIDFGAFVDIGVHQDGLLHISQICDRFIRHPSEVLRVGDVIEVTIIGVDPDRRRISLSCKGL